MIKRDIDTEEQINLFDEWTKLTADFYDRQRHHSGAVGYEEREWDAFQEGWNAAKKHFGVEE
jgi:hypothetical protein